MITSLNRFKRIFDALYNNINNLSKFMITNFSITKIIFIYYIIFIKMSNDFKQRLKHVYFNDFY